MKVNKEVIYKFLTAPGLCSSVELQETKVFFQLYESCTKAFLEAMFQKNAEEIYFPLNLGYIQSKLKDCDWYIDFVENKGE